MSAEGAMGTAMAGARRGNIWRSIGAVLAGFVAIVVLSLGTDVVLQFLVLCDASRGLLESVSVGGSSGVKPGGEGAGGVSGEKGIRS